MNKRSWILLIVTGLVVGSLLAGGCAKQAGVSTPIKIGALVSKTGVMTDLGGRVQDGMNLALDEAGSKVAGREVQILIADDGSTNPAMTMDSMRKLVESDGVCMMFTPIFPPSQEALLPYLEAMKVPSCSMMQTEWALQKYQYHFSPLGTYAGMSYDLGLYAYDVLGYKTVTLLAEDTVGPRAFVLSAAQAFKSRGGTVTQLQYYPVGAMDFSPYITNLKQADCFLFMAPGMQVFLLTKQYRSFGVKMPMISTADVIGEENVAGLGDDGVGIIDETFYTSSIDTPANKKFVAAYQAKYGRNPAPAMITWVTLTCRWL